MEIAVLLVVALCILLAWGPRVLLACIAAPVALWVVWLAYIAVVLEPRLQAERDAAAHHGWNYTRDGDYVLITPASPQ